MWRSRTASPIIPKEYSDYRKDYGHISRIANEKKADDTSTISSLDTKDDGDSEHINIDIPPLPVRTKHTTPFRCCLPWRKSRHRSARQRDARLTCQTCDQWFFESDNKRGVCSSRRGHCDSVVDSCTCMPIVESCSKRRSKDRSDSSSRSRVRHLLGFILPCIWCYSPCKACVARGKRRHRWGPRHVAASSSV